MHRLKIALVGATGALGRELLGLLEDREVPLGDLALLSSERSAGQKLEVGEEPQRVRPLTPDSFAGVDLVLFATPPAVTRAEAPRAVAAGALAIDLSGAFSLEGTAPPFQPELASSQRLQVLLSGHGRILACPGAPAALCALALAPFRDAGLAAVHVTALQPAASAGQRGVEELEAQSRALFNLAEVEARTFPHRLGFNLLPAVGHPFSPLAPQAPVPEGAAPPEEVPPGEAGLETPEEQRIAAEVRALLGMPKLLIAASCVQVPVFFGTGLCLSIGLSRPLGPSAAQELLRRAPGVKLVDDLAGRVYPMPMLAIGDEAALAGRVRSDASRENGLSLFVAGDELRRTAASALALCERLVRDHPSAFPRLRN
jgi:aspartate-semialdehyde dehydrogenase